MCPMVVDRRAQVNVAHLLVATARCHARRPALTWRGKTLDYGGFADRAATFAGWLAGSVQRDRPVVLFLDNRPELLVAMFGSFLAGCTVVPVNSRLTGDELAFLVQDCAAGVIVTDPAHADTARRAAGNEAIVLIAGEDFDTELDRFHPLDRAAEVGADDIAWIFYTSGTTGHPKGAMLPHDVLNFVTVSWLADLTPLTEHDVTLHATPLTHGAGFHALAAVARGAHNVILDEPRFDPSAVFDVLAAREITNTWLVPTQIVLLTEAAEGGGLTGADLPHLQYVVYGGAPMSPSAMGRAIERFGPVFVQLYGQGETPMTATMLRRDEHVPALLDSAGRPRAGIEVRVVGVDGGLLAPDEVGEIVVRGPSVMAGYWNRSEATAEAIVEGWLHTGDLGTMSADGILHILDRTKDMIISGGSNVYAAEVERVLAASPLVGDVAVIGTADEVWGEVVTAVVVPADASSFDPGELDLLARGELAGYKVPRRYVAVETLPRRGNVSTAT